jgi:Rod binding domain-containing protein
MDISSLNLSNVSNMKDKNNLDHLKDMSTKLNGNKDKELKKLSKDFESIFLKQLLDVSMKNSTFAGEGAGKDIIMGMYTDQLSQAGSGGFGFSSMIYDYLKQQSTLRQIDMKAKLEMEGNK